MNMSTTDTNQEKDNRNGELLRFIIIAAVTIYLVRTFIATPFIVSGASMKNTFNTSDYLIIEKISYRLGEPERGDIVVFKYPFDPARHHIKRIIGLPGETVSVEGRKVRVINEAHPEGFLLDESYLSVSISNSYDTRTLGEDEYYVMGDNRDHSLDSRRDGALPAEYIDGRVLMRLYPFNQVALLPGTSEQ